MEVTLSSFEVWWAGPNCSVTFNLSKSVEKSMENQQADNWKWKNGQIWRFALLSGRSITQSISTDIAGNGLKLNYKVKVVCGAVCDFETGWFRWSMWWSFGLRCSLGKNSSYICSLTSITIKPWVNLKSCFLQLNNEKRGGGVFFTVRRMERRIPSLSLSARPPESSIQSGRRSLTQGGRDIPSLCTPEGEGVMSENPMNTETRGQTPVWIMYFSGSDGPAAEVVTDSCFSGAKTRFTTS